MSYITQADLQARLPAFGGESGFAPLTTLQVDAIIEGVEAELDMILAGMGLSVPVTDPATAVRYLKAVAVWGSAAEVQRARFREGSGANSESQWKFYKDRYDGALARIPSTIDGLMGAPTVMRPTSWWQDNPDEPGNDPALTTTMDW